MTLQRRGVGFVGTLLIFFDRNTIFRPILQLQQTALMCLELLKNWVKLSLMQVSPAPPEGYPRTASVKMHSIPFLPRGSGALQKCSSRAAGTASGQMQNRIMGHFWVLAMKMLLHRDSGGSGERKEKERNGEEGTERNGREGKERKKKNGREKREGKKGTEGKKNGKKEKEKDPQKSRCRSIFVGTLTPKSAP